jgi:peptide/nickel transport system substrate-binding protein
LAGCSNNDDSNGTGTTESSGGSGSSGGGGNELGERVPDLQFEYLSNVGLSPIIEDQLPSVISDLEELGLNIEPHPLEFLTAQEHNAADTRSSNLFFWYYGISLGRNDPHPLLRRQQITTAGSLPGGSTQYASCEYTRYVQEEATTLQQEPRQEATTNALRTMSDDAWGIPTINTVGLDAARSDEIDIQSGGSAGFSKRTNPAFFIDSSPTNGDSFAAMIPPSAAQTNAFPRIDEALPIWNNLFGTALRRYNQDVEIENVLADSIEISDDSTTVTVEIKDATFHNGDPITAEDVQFTFQYVNDHPESVRVRTEVPYESIDVVDDRTVEFNLEETFGPLTEVVFAKRGIYHKASFEEAGALDNPSSFTFDEMVGSGPFQMESFSQGQSIVLTPYEDHAIFSPDHDLVFQVYEDQQTAVNAFRSNEIQVVDQLSPPIWEDLESEDYTETTALQGMTSFYIWPQHSWGPSKFVEFRKAMGQAINRQRINQLTYGGTATEQTHGAVFSTNHPWYPDDDSDIPKYTDDPTGDIEGARQRLADAGWGWDDNGNLHYPPDADLSPLWPAESPPSPDDYPCLTGDHEYTDDW